MKFLMYSQSGEGSQILKRIELEGNEVSLYIKDKQYQTVFNGLLPKIDNPDSFIDEDTVIIFDMSGNGKEADHYKTLGYHTYGASDFADRLEHDREYGFEVMRRSGIKIPEYEEFTDFKKGLDYIRSSDKRLVFKPSGQMPCKLTYCSKDSKELESYLQFVEKHYAKEIDSFILQEFIEGCVVSSEFFVSQGKFVWPPNHTVEVKKSMNDELGPSTGCSGNICWTCEESTKIIDSGVKLVESLCLEESYTGQIDLNAVANEQGVYGLEWTPRFGYDATPTLLSILEMDLSQFFSDISRGQLKEAKFMKKDVGGIRVTIPPYPAEPTAHKNSEDFSPNMGIPIQNWEDHQNALYFYEVCQGDNGLEHSGGTGVIACAMGTGNSPKECLEQPYDILESLVIPDKQYRTDLKKVLPKMVEEVLEYV